LLFWGLYKAENVQKSPKNLVHSNTQVIDPPPLFREKIGQRGGGSITWVYGKKSDPPASRQPPFPQALIFHWIEVPLDR